MKFIIKVSGAILLVFSIINASAQAKLTINEVMVNNQSSYVDQYGNRSAWIEIYNNSGTSSNLAGWYLSNDRNEPKKYLIAKGDKNTVIGPRQFLVFWADGNGTRGTFYTNFTLKSGVENSVWLSDANGKIKDSLIIPESASLPDLSYGRKVDGGLETGVLNYPTPNINNLPVNQDAANIKFKKNDPFGIGMTITAVMVVFSALILLFIAFKLSGKLFIRLGRKKHKDSLANKGETAAKSSSSDKDGEMSGEIVAAIASVIYQLQNSSHDIENTILTIEKRVSNYSPWSSKIYGLRQIPQVRNK
ncbi:MAG: lamin tail domain-containing protein [Prevotellaceae bacterium]|jgi:Na+-transporting methylmalonyl-CoA/oxaloacetate decarboxylase gamma subunit|nr:lamin tail domain-containing protein [Prevotellaceae bacterium]